MMIPFDVKCPKCFTSDTIQVTKNEYESGQKVTSACKVCGAQFGFKNPGGKAPEIASNSKFGLGRGKKGE